MNEINETLDRFWRSVDLFGSTIERMPAGAWHRPTPCDGWDATDLVRHQCGVLDALAAIARTGEINRPEMAPETDDPAARWAETRDGLTEALSDVDLSTEDQYWFGPMSFEDFVGMVQWDPLTHAWDLAQAGGIEVELPADLCEVSLARVRSLGDIPRKWKLIGDEIEVGADASPQERFLAYVGRQP